MKPASTPVSRLRAVAREGVGYEHATHATDLRAVLGALEQMMKVAEIFDWAGSGDGILIRALARARKVGAGQKERKP